MIGRFRSGSRIRPQRPTEQHLHVEDMPCRPQVIGASDFTSLSVIHTPRCAWFGR